MTKIDLSMQPAQQKVAVEATTVFSKKVPAIFSSLSEIIEKTNIENNKSIVVLGMPQSGTTTLSYYLAQQKLIATYNNEEGKILIEPVNQLKNLVINHEVAAKQKSDKIIIWDCSGYFDTSEIDKEIVSNFYINRLFTAANWQLKFVVTLTQESSEKLDDLKNIIEYLENNFKSVGDLANHLSLVITKTDHIRTTQQVVCCLKKMINKQSSNLPENIKKILVELINRNSIYIFSKPEKKGDIKTSEMLWDIEENSQYLAKKALALPLINISGSASKYVNELIEIVKKNIISLVDIINIEVINIDKDVDSHNFSKFIFSYKLIENWLPKEQNFFSKNSSAQLENNYFAKLKQLADLDKVLNNADDNLNKLIHTLKILAKYAGDITLKQYIQAHAYMLWQQFKYLQFLVIANGDFDNQPININSHQQNEIIKELDSYMYKVIADSKGAVTQYLQENIKNIDLKKLDEADYYHQAIVYLDMYPQALTISSKKAIAFENLGRILQKNNQDKQALNKYLQALTFDRKLYFLYEAIGDLLSKHLLHKQAITCYKAIYNFAKVKNLYEKLAKEDPDNAADFFVSLGNYANLIGYSNSTKYYYQAFSLAKTMAKKAEVMTEISKLLSENELTKTIAVEFKQKILYQDFVCAEQVNIEQIKHSLENSSLQPEIVVEHSALFSLNYQEIIEENAQLKKKLLNLNKLLRN